MPAQVTYDEILVQGVNLAVDPQTSAVRLEIAFRKGASGDATGEYALPVVVKSKAHLLDSPFDVASLPANPTRRDVVLALWQAVAQALAAEELA